MYSKAFVEISLHCDFSRYLLNSWKSHKIFQTGACASSLGVFFSFYVNRFPMFPLLTHQWWISFHLIQDYSVLPDPLAQSQNLERYSRFLFPLCNYFYLIANPEVFLWNNRYQKIDWATSNGTKISPDSWQFWMYFIHPYTCSNHISAFYLWASFLLKAVERNKMTRHSKPQTTNRSILSIYLYLKICVPLSTVIFSKILNIYLS